MQDTTKAKKILKSHGLKNHTVRTKYNHVGERVGKNINVYDTITDEIAQKLSHQGFELKKLGKDFYVVDEFWVTESLGCIK